MNNTERKNSQTASSASKESPQTSLAGGLKKLWPLLLLAVFVALAWLSGWSEYFDFARLAANRARLTQFTHEHFWLSLLAFGMTYGLVIALSLPAGTFLTIIGGFLFGPLSGTIVTVISATIGAMLIYGISRASLDEGMMERAGPRLERLRRGFAENAMSYMLFLRLVPLFPFWLVNIAPALLGVGPSVYFWGTLLGIIPATWAFSYVGAGLGSVLDAQQKAYDICVNRNDTEGVRPTDAGCGFSLDPQSMVTPELLMALCALGLVALLPIAIKRLGVFGKGAAKGNRIDD